MGLQGVQKIAEMQRKVCKKKNHVSPDP